MVKLNPPNAAIDGPAMSPAQRLAVTAAAIPVILWAGGSLAFEVTVLTGGTIATLSALTAAASATALGGALALTRGIPVDPRQAGGWRGARFLAALMVLAALITLLAHRPDPDETHYLANVAHALKHRDAPITHAVRGIDATPLRPFVSAHWSNAAPYDYLSAVIEIWTGLHYLDARYLLLPALAAVVFVATAFLLLRRFGLDEGQAVIAVLFLIGVLALWRESHRAFGNFSFVRLFQAKAIVLTVVVPLVTALALGFLRRPDPKTWFALAAVTLAGAGMSASILPVAAASLAGLVTGMVWAAPAYWRPTLRRAVLLGPAFLPVGFALARILASADLPIHWSENPANRGWPTTFLGHAKLVGLSTHLLMATCAAAVLVFWTGPMPKILLGWMLVLVVLFLNPVSGDVLIESVIGPNIYWRFYYALPWIPLIGLGLFALAGRLSARPRHSAARIALLTVVVGIAAAAYEQARDPHRPLWPPSWKLHPPALAATEAILAKTPPGTMLAPDALARTVVILDGERPQLSMRRYDLKVWALGRGRPDLAERRLAAVDLVAGKRAKGRSAKAAALGRVLSETRPMSVVVARRNDRLALIRGILEAHGYAAAEGTARFEIWTRR